MTTEIKPLANCGCVYHAEEGIPCEHDLELWAEMEGSIGSERATKGAVGPTTE